MVLMLATQLSVLTIGFETANIPQSEKNSVANRIFYSQYNTKKEPFSNFDVNERGMISIVTKSGTANPSVCVYDKEGVFQYKYTVDTDGVIYTEWEEENLWIYIVRGDHAVLVDDKGMVLKVEKILETKENTSYWFEVWETKKAMGDKIYVARTGLGVLGLMANDYAQVVVTDANGEEEVLYDVKSVLLIKTLLTILLIVFLIFVAVSVIILAVKNSIRHQNRIHFGNNYKPNAKKTFYDRILDALDKRKNI